MACEASGMEAVEAMQKGSRVIEQVRDVLRQERRGHDGGAEPLREATHRPDVGLAMG